MLRPRFHLAAALSIVLTLVPAVSLCGPTSIALGDQDDFGWTIVTDERQSISTGRITWDSVQNLRKRYGPELLVVSDRDENWVITDRKLIDRARRTARKISHMEPEIGEMAEAQARLSLSESSHGPSKESLRKRQAALRKEIRAAQDEGKSTEALEEDLFHVNVELKALNQIARDHRLTAGEKQDLTRRWDRASSKVNAGMRKINDEIRDLLEEAKSRGLARRVTD